MNKGIRVKMKQETNALKSYFGRKIEPSFLELPDSDWERIENDRLGLHFIPKLSYKDFPDGACSPFFFKLIARGALKKSSLRLKPGWMLVEKEPKLAKNRIWLHKNVFFDLLDRVGIRARKLCGLDPEMKFPGFNKFSKRLGTTRKEIEDKILPSAREELELEDLRLSPRLPYYLEYVYLGKNFYNNWGKTRTWEWLEDKLADGRSLAAGFKKASSLGADPAAYWSTILSYRLIFEIKSKKTK